MKLINRLKYRWNYCSDPLPGEYSNPIPGVTVLVWTEEPDKEKVILLRKLRALLFGYGQGWTFFGAFFNFLLG
jgi:hypothetical protein